MQRYSVHDRVQHLITTQEFSVTAGLLINVPDAIILFRALENGVATPASLNIVLIENIIPKKKDSQQDANVNEKSSLDITVKRNIKPLTMLILQQSKSSI